MKLILREPTKEEIDELLLLKKNAKALLKIEFNDGCKETISILADFLELYYKKERKDSEEQKVYTAYGLGEIFASYVIKTYGWKYSFCKHPSGFDGFIIIEPKNRCYIFVHHFFYNLIDRQCENNFLSICELLSKKDDLQKIDINSYRQIA